MYPAGVVAGEGKSIRFARIVYTLQLYLYTLFRQRTRVINH